MHNGPVVQNELSSILLRFRKPRFVFTTDIEKMYRQILINPRDEHLQIIIWRESPEENLCYYKLKTVTYGTRAAPYLATKCLHTLAREHTIKFPLGSATLSKHFYGNDGLSGSDSLMEAIATKDQLIKILATAGFKPRKWCANNAQLLQGLAPEDQEVDLDVSKYLNELQCRTKCKNQSPDDKEGMLVIIQEDDAPPLQWPLGRIIKCYSGNDGRIRVVDIKTKNGIWKRPIHRLAPLLSEEWSTPMIQPDRCDEETPKKIAKLNMQQPK
ncbi:uncharacterized protein LOC119675768 [Teleopsis dalmanni]|uniref:uncharacterized protein LOC119675768 n=1 Tax=Teleopsis dalmanni TaxID=139649 RepID=UPI0018CC8593|nr:uncharacterized protein LOC119675768 [Teleopsis dalmanni]